VNPGLYRDLPAEEYRAKPGLSCSMLKAFARSPAHLQEKLRNPEQTPAMRIGSLLHLAVLEPSKWSEVEVAPNEKRPTKAQLEAKKPSQDTLDLIAFWEAWDKAHEGKEVVKEQESLLIDNMAEAVFSCPKAMEALSEGLSEVSLFAPIVGEGFNLMRKARLDRVTGGSAIVDLKKCTDARLEKFEKDSLKYKYHMQGAYYLDVWEALYPRKTHFVIIAIEEDPPYGVCVYNMDAEAIERGRQEYLALLPRYQQCVDSGVWPGYANEIQSLGLPGWARRVV
jgi:hypothetical protein